jgi:hypothetical protein
VSSLGHARPGRLGIGSKPAKQTPRQTAGGARFCDNRALLCVYLSAFRPETRPVFGDGVRHAECARARGPIARQRPRARPSGVRHQARVRAAPLPRRLQRYRTLRLDRPGGTSVPTANACASIKIVPESLTRGHARVVRAPKPTAVPQPHAAPDALLVTEVPRRPGSRQSRSRRRWCLSTCGSQARFPVSIKMFTLNWRPPQRRCPTAGDLCVRMYLCYACIKIPVEWARQCVYPHTPSASGR